MPQFTTAKGAAQYLNLSDSTIYKRPDSGEIPVFKIGDSWRSDISEIKDFFKKCKKATRPGRNRREKNRDHTGLPVATGISAKCPIFFEK